MADAVGGVVEHGEHHGAACHQGAEDGTGGHGDENQPAVGHPDFLLAGAGTQHLAHDDADGIAHGHKCHAGQIEEGGGDVEGGHHVQATGGVALGQERHAGGPQELVAQQGHALDGDGPAQVAGDPQGPVGAPDEGIFPGIQVGPQNHDGQFHIPGDDGGNGGTVDAQFGRAKVAEDQHIVQCHIQEHSDAAGHRGHDAVIGLAEGARIGVGQGERRQTQQHDLHVVHAVCQGGSRGLGIGLAPQVQQDQGFAAGEENGDATHRQGQTDQDLVAEGMADALLIPAAVELGGENTRTGSGAEDAHIEDEEQVVDDGDAAHGNGTNLAHHDVIQQRDKIADAVLDQNRNGHRQHMPVKIPVADKTFKHRKPRNVRVSNWSLTHWCGSTQGSLV